MRPDAAIIILADATAKNVTFYLLKNSINCRIGNVQVVG
jgi:hypothetical protein